MARLNNRAFNILAAEVQRLCASKPLEKVRQDIVLRRLEKFCQAEGPPVTLDELRNTIDDIFPDFSEQVLRQAIKANTRASQVASVRQKLGCLTQATMGTALLAAGIWVLNLPYPMVRWPVARVAPIVLLPSYIRMDHDYRQAVSLVEQADQLVNQATSFDDIDLGAEKVTQAQQHLDGLPVWFLGYYPKAYCGWFGCSWRFTFDEFQEARAAIGRMEAKVFQEQNAQALLEAGTEEVDAAKQAYESAPTAAAKAQALAAWQAGMDKLNEIPAGTYAGRSAATKLEAYRRDYERVSGMVTGSSRTSSVIGAAKAFAQRAAAASQNPPHPVETWRRAATLWQESIRRLEDIQPEDDSYLEAQDLLATYTSNLEEIKVRLATEEASVRAFESAQRKTEQLLALNKSQLTANQMASRLQGIVNDLHRVQSGTTVYSEAQEMLASAEDKLTQLNP
ncbi:uncharacterized protein XM38_045090 [Halomicronema hongdechloris C2206]|uniref:Uncharacterized protein n=1 Tax=Halomicronema hongdechloris C2206 TaxID=1641165 RepID=A0A1Z3HT85_9CYAN|nr:hypothetical protein [Halomicronema hongdechloris]ASC73541.1 uncharacterized protein XM38_045090 [Halomicronema hongdechloris C2206]